MMKKLLSLVMITAFCQLGQAQTVMTVGKEKVDVKEFKRVYEKNNTAIRTNPYTRSNLDTFTQLYSLFLMKLQEAKSDKLDTSTEYKTEVERYKMQLADKYQKENQYMDQMVREAYNREKNEYHVSHIMLPLNPSEGTDTTRKIKELQGIKDQIDRGDISFGVAAQTYSLDKSSAENDGSIGWVTSMQTPYSLENVFINMKKGQISDPVVSEFGVHLLKLDDERPNFGQMKVAQILIQAVNKKGDELAEAQKKANEVYKELKSGKISFEDAVKKYSGDVYSNNNNGELDWFGPGDMVDTFEDVSLALKVGEISKPVYTTYGFHIIKKIDQKPHESFDERQKAILNKIQYTERGQKAKEYNYQAMLTTLDAKQDQNELVKIMSELDSTSFYSGSVPSKYTNKVMFTIQGQKYTFGDLYNFMQYITRGRLGPDRFKLMASVYDNYFGQELQKHYMDVLAEENPDYAHLIQDYSDGILIFDLMEQNIWQKAAEDTTGQRAYFDSHRSKYVWGPSIEYDYYRSTNKEDLVELQKVLGKETSVPDEAVSMVKSENPESTLVHQHKKEEISKMDPDLASKLKNYQSTPIIEDKGQFVLYVPNQYLAQPSDKTFEEARSYVISDYQNQLEKDWNNSLKTKYPLTINTKVYDTLIKN